MTTNKTLLTESKNDQQSLRGMKLVMILIFTILISLFASLIFNRQISNLVVICCTDTVESKALASYMRDMFTMAPENHKNETFRTLTALKYPANANGDVSVCFNHDCVLLDGKRNGMYALEYIDAKYDEINKRWLVKISSDDFQKHPFLQVEDIYDKVDDARLKKESMDAHKLDLIVQSLSNFSSDLNKDHNYDLREERSGS